MQKNWNFIYNIKDQHNLSSIATLRLINIQDCKWSKQWCLHLLPWIFSIFSLFVSFACLLEKKLKKFLLAIARKSDLLSLQEVRDAWTKQYLHHFPNYTFFFPNILEDGHQAICILQYSCIVSTSPHYTSPTHADHAKWIHFN